MLAFLFEVDRLALFEELESGGPEIEVEDFAFARQDVVFDVEAEHGGEVRLNDGVGDEVGEFGKLALAGLDGVQGLLAPGEGFGLVLVGRRGTGVEVPAVVIEADGGVVDNGLDVGGGFLFEEVEANDDVGHLDASVVDVVLDLDLMSPGTQHADEGVAERRVAEVADMCGLVGVDVGVLNDDFFGGLGRFGSFAAQERVGVSRAVEADIDVAVACDFQRGDAGDGRHFGDQLRGDDLGRLAKLSSELKGGGDGHFTELALAGLLDRDRELDAVTDQDVGVESAGDFFFNGMEHGNLSIAGTRRQKVRS